MPKMIFVNLPVRDVKKATDFYLALGATKDERFSDATGSCIVISDTIFVMLLSREKFSQFTTKEIADASRTAQVLLCLSCESSAEVDDTVERAAAAGGKPDPGPRQDHGFMYGRSFEDLDGHIFEVMWMDVEAAMRAFGKNNAA